jgi:hypothetical protein
MGRFVREVKIWLDLTTVGNFKITSIGLMTHA